MKLYICELFFKHLHHQEESSCLKLSTAHREGKSESIERQLWTRTAALSTFFPDFIWQSFTGSSAQQSGLIPSLFLLFQLHPQLPADVRADAAVWLQGDWAAQERGWLLSDWAPDPVPGRPQTPAALPHWHLRRGGGAVQHQETVQVLQPCCSHHQPADHHHQGQWEQVWWGLYRYIMAEYSVKQKQESSLEIMYFIVLRNY